MNAVKYLACLGSKHQTLENVPSVPRVAPCSDANGSGYDNYDYLPFGETRSGGWGTTHKFTGDERDSEANSTRLLRPDAFDRDHTLFRQYSSTLGRWSSPDPLAGDISDPQSLNRYTYVRNNPLSFIDPFGLDFHYCYFGQMTYRRNPDASYGDPASIGGPFADDSEFQGDDDPNSGPEACKAAGGSWTLVITGDGGGGGGGDSVPPPTVSGFDDPTANWSPGSPNGSDGSGDGSVGGGGASRGSANNKAPWYRNSCVTGALGNGLLHVGVDAIGLIPEGGVVSKAVGNLVGWRGIVATQQGTKAIQAVKAAAGIGSTGVGSDDTSSFGLTQTGLGVAGIVTTLAGATPVVGQVLSGLSILADIYHVGKDIAKCN